MKYQSIQSLSIALILFSLGQIAFGQGESTPAAEPQAIGVAEDPVLLPYSEEEFTELKAAMSSGDQKAVEAITRRHDERERNHRRDRRKPVEPLPDDPIPDQNEGEGESVSPANPVDPNADPTIEPIEGREERERRRREREERKREQEEYERANPKPQRQGLFSWLFWGTIELFLWPFTWIFTLIKWGGIFVLLTVIVCVVALGILCGSMCMRVIRWTLDRLISKPEDPSP